VRAAVELARELAPGEGGGDLLSSLAPGVLNLITTGMQQSRNAAAAHTGPRAVAPLPARTPTPAPVRAPGAAAAAPAPPAAAGDLGSGPATAAAGSIPSSAIAAFVRGYAPLLLGEARKDNDPSVLAAFAVERIPEAFRGPLMDLCRATPEARIDLLERCAPGITEYQAWIDELAAAVIDEFEREASSVDDGSDDEARDDRQRGAGDPPERSGDRPADPEGSGSPDGASLRGAA
jgi:hypothetical protein